MISPIGNLPPWRDEPNSLNMTTIDPTQAVLDLCDWRNIPVAAYYDVSPVAHRAAQTGRSPSRIMGHEVLDIVPAIACVKRTIWPHVRS